MQPPQFPLHFEETKVTIGSYIEFSLPLEETNHHHVIIHVACRSFDEITLQCLAWAIVDTKPMMHCVWGDKVKKPAKNSTQDLVDTIMWAINNSPLFYESLEAVLGLYDEINEG